MRRKLAFFLILVSPIVAGVTEPAPTLRLPRSVRPVRQAVELTLVPGKDSFDGRIEFSLQVSEPRDVIWINARDVEIRSATVNGQPATTVAGNKSVTGIVPSRRLVPGAARMTIEYTGRIYKDDSAGVFQLKEGNEWYVYTQFEPIDARRAFPCFDEPDFKAPWRVTLRVPERLKAFSNTPETSSTPAGDGMKMVRFAETRPLPSYLVAFAAGPFDVVDAGRSAKRKVPLRIIVPAGHAGEAGFAREAIPKLLTLLENYFGTPYPYEKLDSIVMPVANFAMENVGLITYGQSLLLAPPGQDSITRRRGCAVTVAHEMAHQWFGDLVTTAWWDDIWLNEAFATWMENKIVERWKPEWRIDVARVEDRTGAMGLDSLVSARKIRQPIESEGDIANAFDGITYQKGGAVIYMFEQWMGEDRFRRGVQDYLRRYVDRAATAKDFLQSLSTGAGRDVTNAFSTFLDQPGAPEIETKLLCEGGKASVALSQKRSLPIGSPGQPNERWVVPVCMKYDSGGRVQHVCNLLADPSAMFSLPSHSCPTWLFANDHSNGYYHVNYRGDLLRNLIAMGTAHLTTPEKVGFLADVRASVGSGELAAAEALKLAPEFGKDPEAEVVAGALALVRVLPPERLPHEVETNREAFIRNVFGQRAHQLGWSPKSGEGDGDGFLRRELVPFVAAQGMDRELISEAEKLAREWLHNRKGVDHGMLGSVLSVAAEFGNRALFDQILAAAKAETEPRTRETLIGALGSFRNPELARAAMDLILTRTFDVREGFYPLLFGPLAYRETEKLPFEFVRNHLTELLNVLPHEVGGDYSASLVGVGGAFCSEEGDRQVEQFFGPKVRDWTGGDRRLANVREEIRLCEKRLQALLPSYAEGLAAGGQ